MRIEFTYTGDDVAEMGRVAATDGTANPRQRLVVGTVGWVLFIGMAVMFFVLLQGRSAAPPAAPAAAPPPQAGSESLVATILIPLVPWVLVFLVIWFVVFRQLRFMLPRGVWEQSAALQQPQVVELGEGGVDIFSPHSETRWRWPAFDRWTETKNLLLLRIAGHARPTYLTIPKRAVPPEQLDELRQLLDAHVLQPAGGFPVVPVSQRPPPHVEFEPRAHGGLPTSPEDGI